MTMATIKRALVYSIVATILTGIIFFSQFTSIIAIPWHTNTYKIESDGQTEQNTTNLDPTYIVNIEDSGFAPVVLLPDKELDENSDVTYLVLEDTREFTEENDTGFLDVSRNTRFLVLGSFVLSLLATIIIGLVAKQRVGKGVGTAVAALALALLLATSFYYPVMNAKEISDNPDNDTTFGKELKNFYFNSSSEEFEGGSFSATQLVGIGWIFMFVSALLTGAATSTTHHFFASGNKHLENVKKKDRGTVYANLGSIDPSELGAEENKDQGTNTPLPPALSPGPPSLQQPQQPSYPAGMHVQQYPHPASSPSPMHPPQAGSAPYGQQHPQGMTPMAGHHQMPQGQTMQEHPAGSQTQQYHQPGQHQAGQTPHHGHYRHYQQQQ